jgi:hypothetical protein
MPSNFWLNVCVVAVVAGGFTRINDKKRMEHLLALADLCLCAGVGVEGRNKYCVVKMTYRL